MSHPLQLDNVWLDQHMYQSAESQYHQALSGGVTTGGATAGGGVDLINEIKKVRENIKNTLTDSSTSTGTVGMNHQELVARIQDIEAENKELRKVTMKLQECMNRLDSRVAQLEKGGASTTPATTPATAKPTPVANGNDDDDDDDDDDDVDLFGSDEELDAEAERLKQERVEAYTAKKTKKPGVIAKSSVILDIKPWDDETDMKQCETLVRTIEQDGLLWGASKLVPLAYGIMKLQMMCVVEDEKVSIEDLSEKIQEFEDFVQSVDVAAFNKI